MKWINKGFSLFVLKLIQTCLTERKQRTKTNQVWSPWKEIRFGFSPMIYTWSDFIQHFSKWFVYCSTIYWFFKLSLWKHYKTDCGIDEVIFSQQESSEKLLKWFADNQMKSNIDKCHLIANTNELSKFKQEIFSLKVTLVKKCWLLTLTLCELW